MSPSELRNRACPVCHTDDKKLLFRQQFTGISAASLLAGYDVVICRTCGFCFADGLPDQTAFDVYYREMSKYEHQDRAGQPSEFESRQFPALARLIQEHIPDSHARILEIGCANGGLLNALKQSGYQNLLGADPSPICAQNAKQLYQIRVLTSALSDVHGDIGPFDFIILVAVLEHIQDLDSALLRLRDLLSSNGKLYIVVPDATKFATSPDAPFQEFSIEHVNFFSPVSLANLLRAYGFSPVFSTQTVYDQTDTETGYAVSMVFQKNNEIAPFNLVHDLDTEAVLTDYIAASQRVEDRIHRVINDLADSQSPLIVWGVGTHTQRLLAASRLAEANVAAFVDSNPNYQGKQLSGIQILAPADLHDRGEPILVSSRVYQSEIVRQIRDDLKLENKVLTLYED